MPKKSSPTMRTISLIALVFFLSGCTVTVPERFATLQEAYPPGESLSPPPDAPPDSFKKASFEAPYEDVFRAVSVAASQAQFNVESTDKRKGSILATRVIMVQGPVNRTITEPRQYSYAIVAKEIGPKATEVMTLARVQQTCTRDSGLTWTLVSIFTFGIALPTALIMYPVEKIRCDNAATVQWATGPYTTLQEMNQLMTFARNNLIAAGAL